jgi:hypothetical protein
LVEEKQMKPSGFGKLTNLYQGERPSNVCEFKLSAEDSKTDQSESRGVAK